MTRGLAVAVLLVGMGLLSGCSREEPPPPPPIPTPEVTTADLFVLTRQADLVVAAEVVAVGPGPKRFGDPPPFQGVTYRVLEVFKGERPEGGIVRVAHPVVRSRPLVDDEIAGLAEQYFHEGARLVLYLARDDAGRQTLWVDGEALATGYYVFDDRKGVLLYDDATVAEVRDAVAAHGGGSAGGGDPFRRRR